MAIIIDPRPGAAVRPHPERETLRIGLLNNMPDSALQGTEMQFMRLLTAAAQGRSIHVRLASLPEAQRGEAARQHMQAAYWNLDQLLASSLDGLIVTGTEPRTAKLPDEPYWNSLTSVVDWAESNTVSTVWSCLAAHAAVLHLDGIQRRRLPKKCFGVFEHVVARDHPLTADLSHPSRTPHSRWNELPSAELTTCGYRIISESADCGANLFVKQRRSLFLFVQGHPEYEDNTLLKEYRRDVLRFLKREQSVYPSVPEGYFSQEARRVLDAFREAAGADPRPDLLDAFPFAACAAGLQNTWQRDAASLYQNWLAILAARELTITESEGKACGGLHRS